MIHGGEFALIGNHGAVPVDPRFERTVHSIDEVAAMESRVKSENAAPQEPFEDLSIPGTDGIAFRIAPGDVPKRHDRRVRQMVAHDLGHQGQMEILHEHDGVVGFGFLDDGQRKPFVDLLVLFPVRGSKDGTDMGQMTERPEPFVGKSVVVAVFFLRRHPNPPDLVCRVIRRDADMAARIDDLAVGRAAAMRDPHAGAGTHNRFQSCDDPAGRHLDFDMLPLPIVEIRLTVRGNQHFIPC